MYNTLDALRNGIKTGIHGENWMLTVSNKDSIRDTIVDSLVYSAVFGSNEVKNEARRLIRRIAPLMGVVSTSIHPFYMAIGSEEVKQAFTVPAFNIRMMTYDSARLLFRLAKKTNTGPFVFEIARSEIEYTDQRPEEYAVVVLAAAIKEGYTGPVFLQGDHYQFSARRFQESRDEEIDKIEKLVDESLRAGFLNIDIDASTLVDLEKTTQDEQQYTNYEVTSHFTKHIRKNEPKGVTVSIGAEIGHIGGKNSTPGDLAAFMDGYKKMVPAGMAGISKISVQTGTSHGGIPLPDGTMAKVSLDFDVIAKTGVVARDQYRIGGVVQHGASTLPPELFGHFPKHKTLEIHLATGFQNIVYDNMPTKLRDYMNAWTEENCKKEWEEGLAKEQFVYKTRKKAIGQFKKELWHLSKEEKQPILNKLAEQFSFLFNKLQVKDTRETLNLYVPTS